MRIRKKKWVAPYIENEDRYIIKRAAQINKTKDRLYVEIGMGMGDFITKSASLNPGILYIGLEKEATCVAKAAIKASEYDLDNLGIIFDGADNIEAYFDHNVDRIYLHFSDPWPKKAHAKRRLTYHTFLAKYKQVLKADGEIIFKTDNAGLFEFSIIEFLNNVRGTSKFLVKKGVLIFYSILSDIINLSLIKMLHVFLSALPMILTPFGLLMH